MVRPLRWALNPQQLLPLFRAAAESIGVISDPEMAVVQLGPQHRFLLLASDGVWEFITSQQAVDLVSTSRQHHLSLCRCHVALLFGQRGNNIADLASAWEIG
jgi:serine/threonine protein phosphatase PrpC